MTENNKNQDNGKEDPSKLDLNDVRRIRYEIYKISEMTEEEQSVYLKENPDIDESIRDSLKEISSSIQGVVSFVNKQMVDSGLYDFVHRILESLPPIKTPSIDIGIPPHSIDKLANSIPSSVFPSVLFEKHEIQHNNYKDLASYSFEPEEMYSLDAESVLYGKLEELEAVKSETNYKDEANAKIISEKIVHSLKTDFTIDLESDKLKDFFVSFKDIFERLVEGSLNSTTDRYFHLNLLDLAYLETKDTSKAHTIISKWIKKWEKLSPEKQKETTAFVAVIHALNLYDLLREEENFSLSSSAIDNIL